MMIGLILFLGIAIAQTETASPSVKPEETIDKAFQREFIYLNSQRETLIKQKQRTEHNLSQRIAAAKAQTVAAQKEMVVLSGENDDLHEELTELDRRKKELQKRGTSLESTYKKSKLALAEYAAGLHFESSKDKTTVNVPEELSIAQMEEIFSEANALLEQSSKVEVFPSTFLNKDNKLVSGTVTRFGRVAAIGSVDNSHYVLGPNGEGLLKALETSPSPNESSLHLYVFHSLNKAAMIKKQGTLVEKLADLSPLIFLSLILLLIAGLFSSLLKV